MGYDDDVQCFWSRLNLKKKKNNNIKVKTT